MVSHTHATIARRLVIFYARAFIRRGATCVLRFAVLVTDRLADSVHFISQIAFAHVRFNALSVATLVTNRFTSVIINWPVAVVAVTKVISSIKNILHAMGIHAFRYADRHASVVLHFIGRTALSFVAIGGVILEIKLLIVRVRFMVN